MIDVLDSKKASRAGLTKLKDKSKLEKASIYGAGAYALYNVADEAPEEAWFLGFFLVTWKYIGGLFGFFLAIPVSLFAFVMRNIRGKKNSWLLKKKKIKIIY